MQEIFVQREKERQMSVTQILHEQNISCTLQILHQAVIPADRHISMHLAIPCTEKVFYVERLRYAAGIPCSIEKSYIPYTLVEGIEAADLTDSSFYAVLEKNYGIHIARSTEEILIVEAGRKEAELLGIQEAEEIAFITGNARDEKQMLEYFEISAVSSFYRYRSVNRV